MGPEDLPIWEPGGPLLVSFRNHRTQWSLSAYFESTRECVVVQQLFDYARAAPGALVEQSDSHWARTQFFSITSLSITNESAIVPHRNVIPMCTRLGGACFVVESGAVRCLFGLQADPTTP